MRRRMKLMYVWVVEPFQLNDKVRGLVEKLVGVKNVEVVQKKPIVVVVEKLNTSIVLGK